MKLSKLKKGEIYLVTWSSELLDISKRTELAKFVKKKVMVDGYDFYWYEDKDESRRHQILGINQKNIISIRQATKQEIKELVADEL